MQRIPLYANGPFVSRIAMGCWPIAGITSLGVTEKSSLATIHKAIDEGINLFDTAYSYGYSGESDRILQIALSQRKEDIYIAHKVGQHWNSKRERVVDASPETMLRHTKECLGRLKREYVDLMYLHAPDPKVPLAESASALSEISQLGLARSIGVCNVTLEQVEEISEHCKLSVIQLPFNMIQQDQQRELRSFARERNILIACYWIFMKGLLAGQIRRNYKFEPSDKRLTYPIFQGEAWERSQRLIDQLEKMAKEKSCAISQLVIAWSLNQPQVDIVLLGAKEPYQIEESAQACLVELDACDLKRLDEYIAEVLA